MEGKKQQTAAAMAGMSERELAKLLEVSRWTIQQVDR